MHGIFHSLLNQQTGKFLQWNTHNYMILWGTEKKNDEVIGL